MAKPITARTPQVNRSLINGVHPGQVFQIEPEHISHRDAAKKLVAGLNKAYAPGYSNNHAGAILRLSDGAELDKEIKVQSFSLGDDGKFSINTTGGEKILMADRPIRIEMIEKPVSNDEARELAAQDSSEKRKVLLESLRKKGRSLANFGAGVFTAPFQQMGSRLQPKYKFSGLEPSSTTETVDALLDDTRVDDDSFTTVTKLAHCVRFIDPDSFSVDCTKLRDEDIPDLNLLLEQEGFIGSNISINSTDAKGDIGVPYHLELSELSIDQGYLLITEKLPDGQNYSTPCDLEKASYMNAHIIFSKIK